MADQFRSGGISDHRHPDPRKRPEPALDAPEAAHREHGDPGPLRIGAGQRVAVDEMALRGRDRVGPAGQGVVGGRHVCFPEAEHSFLETEHGVSLTPGSRFDEKWRSFPAEQDRAG